MDSNWFAIFDLWLKFWQLWTVKKLNNIILRIPILQFQSKGSFFLLNKIVKKLQKHKKTVSFVTKITNYFEFYIKNKCFFSWTFHKESRNINININITQRNIKNSVIYNDLAIQNMFFPLFQIYRITNFYLNVASSKLEDSLLILV